MADGRKWVLAGVSAVLLGTVACAGLGCSGVLGAGWWATTPRGQHFPSAVIVEGCEGAVWYRDGDDGLLSDLVLKALLAEMTHDGEFDGKGPPRWFAAGMFGVLMPRELVGCVFPDKRWVGAANPAVLPALWAPIASKVLDEQETFEIGGYRFTRGADQVWGMVDGTIVMGSDRESLVPAVEALVAADPPATELRKEIARLVVHGDMAFLIRKTEDQDRAGTGWVSVDSPDHVHLQVTREVADTEEGTAQAKRMCDDILEVAVGATVTCETTWLPGMRFQLDIDVTGVEAALAAREASREVPEP